MVSLIAPIPLQAKRSPFSMRPEIFAAIVGFGLAVFAVATISARLLAPKPTHTEQGHD